MEVALLPLSLWMDTNAVPHIDLLKATANHTRLTDACTHDTHHSDE